MAINNDVPVVTKLTEIEICKGVCEEIWNDDDDKDQDDDESQLFVKPPINAEMRNALKNLTRCITSFGQFSKIIWVWTLINF